MIPCQADPVSFDVDPDHGTPHPPVNQLVHACLTRCPIFEWCSTQPHQDVYGVVGGRFKPRPIPIPQVGEAPSPATLKAAVHLSHLIAALEQGQEIPTQRDLERQLGVSRGSVRKAMELFAAAGALTPVPSTHGPGFRYVVSTSPDHPAPALAETAA